MKSAYGRVISTILQLRAPQFTVAKTWNQYRRPSTDD